MVHDRLGRLRGLLFRAPSAVVWGGVCRELEDWARSGEGFEVGLEYVAGHLEGWSDVLRVAPWSWWGRVRRGEDWACWGVVRALSLRGMFLNDAELGKVVRVEGLKSVTCLDVGDNRVGPAGVRRLVDGVVGGVRRLDVSKNFLGDAGVDALVVGGLGGALAGLDVSSNHIGDYGFGELVRWCAEEVRGVRVLDASGNAVGVEGVGRLVDAGCLRSLEGLGLSDNTLGVEGVRVLSRNAPKVCLEELRLNGNGIGDEGLACLASWLGVSLRSFAGCHNGITSVGVEKLVEASWLGGVERLDLGFNRIGDRGALALADWVRAGACSLRMLDVRYNRIGDAGARGLVRALGESEVECVVILERNLMSRGVVEELRGSRRPRVVFDREMCPEKMPLLRHFDHIFE